MSKGKGFCRVIPDDNHQISDWIIGKLGFMRSEVDELCTMGFVIDDKLIGGVMFEGNTANSNIWISIYTKDKRWCSRRVVRIVLGFAFNSLAVNRISAIINTDNTSSLSLCQKLGFKNEGKLRQFRRNGQDVYILGLLKSECKFI